MVVVLLDAGPGGRWAADALTGADLPAPSLLPSETADITRRHQY